MTKARWGHILKPTEKVENQSFKPRILFRETCGKDIARRERGLWAGSKAKERKYVGEHVGSVDDSPSSAALRNQILTKHPLQAVLSSWSPKENENWRRFRLRPRRKEFPGVEGVQRWEAFSRLFCTWTEEVTYLRGFGAIQGRDKNPLCCAAWGGLRKVQSLTTQNVGCWLEIQTIRLHQMYWIRNCIRTREPAGWQVYVTASSSCIKECIF